MLDGLDKDVFDETLHHARQRLLDERNEHGWWTGELSSSALSTATAITALRLIDRANGDTQHADIIQHGTQWLIDNQNDDGGWGDTDKSFSNISTTMLCWAALGDFGFRIADFGLNSDNSNASDNQNGDASTFRGRSKITAPAIEKCEQWLTNHAGSLEIPDLVKAVMERYGKDRTFSVPILTMCALCGRLGDPQDRATWKWVKQLPFELAALPQSWFNKVNLQVVSYALPALIAIGLVRHHHRPTWNPITRLCRAMAKKKTLRRLEAIQPPNGGFLEATPLTSFVTMSLAACGLAQHTVSQRGVTFIKKSMRDDGSWPIDTNLATWVTTLSVNALAVGGRLNEHLNESERATIRDWLLDQQYTEVHPYTGAKPGGWAWTDLPGGVPDADDTSGAVLALIQLDNDDAIIGPAVTTAGGWLMSLQNRDGGIPTFCRGWGRLPFDRSSADISAHASRALTESPRFYSADDRTATNLEDLPAEHTKLRTSFRSCVNFLLNTQRDDGSWTPLWFGNQHASSEVNPTYGTAQVLKALPKINSEADISPSGSDYLAASQNDDGGWGGGQDTPSSIEETALAVEALSWGLDSAKPHAADDVVKRGVHWLIEHTQRGTQFPPSPIGFYFAKLWYYEKLYPIIYTVAALERMAVLIEREEETKVGNDVND